MVDLVGHSILELEARIRLAGGQVSMLNALL